MGCFFSSREAPKQEQKKEEKVFSWDLNRPDPKDFTIADLENATVGRLPGTVDGQQFIINNCKNCNIYIFDHSDTIFVDDCENCRFFLGPMSSSVFFRDCSDIKATVACQQFRTRDCKKMEVFLFCGTQPIIESSNGIKFGCFKFYYPELEGQFEKAGLSLYNNIWGKIHDFTPAEGERTFSLMPEDIKIEDLIPLPDTEEFSSMEISTSTEKSVVPVTLGERRKPSDESCLIVFFANSSSKQRIKQFLQELRQNETSCKLVQTKEVKMTPQDSSRVFENDQYTEAVKQGDVIGIEVNGDDCMGKCKVLLQSICGEGYSKAVYISKDKAQATRDIDAFYNFVDMTLAI